MGLFSVRGRLPQPARKKSPIRLRDTDNLAQAVHGLRAVPARFGLLARRAAGKIGRALIAATNDARVVAVLLLLAAAALAVEMAASFHVI
jgi:hypothetical protein